MQVSVWEFARQIGGLCKHLTDSILLSRAMYYGDETFNDATVLKRSRKGWLVSFVGYEGD